VFKFKEELQKSADKKERQNTRQKHDKHLKNKSEYFKIGYFTDIQWIFIKGTFLYNRFSLLF